MRGWLERQWWGAGSVAWPLRVLEPLYAAVADGLAARRRARAARLPVPVLVVGNIAVGGSGKTPVTLAVVEMLRELEATPGILSRGYGGAGPFPLAVTPDTSPEAAGDEPVLLAGRARAPLVVAPSRLAAGRALLATHPQVNVLVCDDGLQHYALVRDAEFAVVDGARGHGNGHRLPAGPLREPVGRLGRCDLVLVNGGDAAPHGANALRFDLVAGAAEPLHGGSPRPLAGFVGEPVTALAGIGHPQRFFDLLSRAGLTVRGRPLADHHRFTAADFPARGPATVFVTEKDAVKCRQLELPPDVTVWVLPVRAVFTPDGHRRVQESLRSLLQIPLKDERQRP